MAGESLTTRRSRLLAAALIISMAFSFTAGQSTATNSSTADQASTTIVLANTTYGGDKFLVLIVAVDNNSTSDGATNEITGVTDTNGNTWTKGVEFTNGQSAIQAGATVSIWYADQKAKSTSGNNTVTVSFGQATSRDKSALSVAAFTRDTSKSIQVEGSPLGLANDGADPGSLNVTTSNIECLRVRGIASESSTTTALTVTTNWTAFAQSVTTGGGSAANMGVRGEFRIATGTSFASDPTLFAADHASAYVAFREVSTGSNFTQNLSGAATPAGSLRRDTSARKTGSATSAGIVTRGSSIIRVGANTPAGSLRRSDAKTIAGTTASAGSIANVRLRLQALAGSIGCGGILNSVKSLLRSYSGSIGGSGTIVRSVADRVAGILGTTSALSSLKTKLQYLAGTQTSAGAVRRSDAKAAAGTAAASGAIRRSMVTAKSGALTPAGNANSLRASLQSKTGSIASSALSRSAVQKRSSGSAGTDGSTYRSAAVRKAGNATSAGSLIAALAQTKQLAGAIATAGLVGRVTSRVLSATGPIAGSIRKTTARVFAAIANAAGSLMSAASGSVESATAVVGDRAAAGQTIADSRAVFLTWSEGPAALMHLEDFRLIEIADRQAARNNVEDRLG